MKKHMFLNSAAVIAVAWMASPPAAAQDEAAPRSSGILSDEIVVTAQKREQSIQDVGVSVTAYDGDDLEALGVTNTADLAKLIPGVNIQSPGGTDLTPIINIRGVSQNDFGDHNEAPVALYVDEGYVSWLGALGMATYDLERVEALRGPQGTLFGRNATGGLIHFITRKPTQDLDRYVRAEYSSYDSYRVEGAIGGGLTDWLAVRLSSAYNNVGNFVVNRAGPTLGNSESFNIRGQALITPSDSAEILLKVDYSSLEGGGSTWTHRAAASDGPGGTGRFLGDTEDFYGTCAGCDVLGYRDVDGDIDGVDLNDPAFIDREVLNLNGKVTIDFGGVTVTSISDYRDVERLYADDADGGPFTLSAYQQNIDGASQFSQEVRLNGETDALKWVVGGYYLNIEGDYSNRIEIDPALTGSGSPTLDFLANTWSLETESYAFFAQGEYAVGSTVSLIGGFRWTHDEKEFDYANTDIFGGGVFGGGLIFNQATVGDLATRSEGDYSFKAQIDWRPTDSALIYFGVSRGNKAGGFSASLDGLIAPSEVNYGAEILTNYELGFKSTLFNGLARLNGSAFYYDYNDYQAFLFEGFTSKIINIDAEVYGGELELISSPWDGADVVLGLSLLESEGKDVPLPDGSFADRPLPQSPGVSFNALVRQNFPLGRNLGNLAAQADVSYSSDYNYNIVGHETTAVDAHAIVNGRLTYTPDNERFSVAFFVENIFEERYVIGAFDISDPLFGGASLRSFNRPRWFGGQVSINFN